MNALLYKQATATATTTDLGEFTAIAAAYTLDRQGERIAPGAFAYTIQRWKGSGKDIPLHWNHQAGADSIIGSIDPATMRETPDGLYVKGSLDIEDSEVAREAWRSLKRNRIGLSFGYLTLDEHDADGATVLDVLDVFEITLTPAPANADTRILSTKSATAGTAEETKSAEAAHDELEELIGRKSTPIKIASFEV